MGATRTLVHTRCSHRYRWRLPTDSPHPIATLRRRRTSSTAAHSRRSIRRILQITALNKVFSIKA